MKIRPYLNGDRCPCCGQEIRGKSEQELHDFNELVAVFGLPFPEDAPTPKTPGPEGPGPEGPEFLRKGLAVPRGVIDLITPSWLETLEPYSVSPHSDLEDALAYAADFFRGIDHG